METLIVLIPSVLLLGAAFQAFFAARSTTKGPWCEKRLGIAGVAAPAVAFLCAVALFLGLDSPGQHAGRIEAHLWNWIAAGNVSIDLTFRVDHLTAVMLLVITGIGSLIHLYSVAYMHGDGGFARYFACLNLFTFFMTVLVLGGDLFVLFIGWEGVGLCSYLLIGFWWTDAEKAQAGLKAFVVNRIGDAAFLLGGFLLWKTAGTLDLARIHQQIESGALTTALEASSGVLGFSVATTIAILLFIGATGKSAQIPLYVWLPDAMAGPTPVSALIHAATMVTAGVYMIARLNALFAMSATAQAVVMAVGALTCVFAGSMALVQFDIKKVLAYSTVSQLGYMFIGVGTGSIGSGVFHLVTHAFFKACLFLGAGSVIHAMHHEQDMRRMGGLKDRMPITCATMMICAAAMAGIPPLSGFFSKDEILWRAYERGGVGFFAWALGSVGAACTAFYAFRLIFMTFGGQYRGMKRAHAHGDHGHGHDDHGEHHALAFHEIKESPRAMVIPLMVLALGGTVIGFLAVPEVLGGHNRFEHYLEPVIAKIGHAHAVEHSPATTVIEQALMLLSIMLAILGIGMAHRYYIAKPALPEAMVARFPNLYARLVKLWGVDEMYVQKVVDPLRNAADKTLHQRIDVRIIEAIVNGCGTVAKRMGSVVSLVQDGSIQNYLTWMVLGVLVMLLTLLA